MQANLMVLPAVLSVVLRPDDPRAALLMRPATAQPANLIQADTTFLTATDWDLSNGSDVAIGAGLLVYAYNGGTAFASAPCPLLAGRSYQISLTVTAFDADQALFVDIVVTGLSASNCIGPITSVGTHTATFTPVDNTDTIDIYAEDVSTGGYSISAIAIVELP